MGEVSTIGLDLAKTLFQAHGADASGGVVFRKKPRRDQLLSFFAGQPRCNAAKVSTGSKADGVDGSRSRPQRANAVAVMQT